MQRNRTLAGLVAGATTLAIALGATAVRAESHETGEPEPGAVIAAEPATTSVTLPLFGAPLTVQITTGPGQTLAAVDVDPADGFTATKVRSHRVVFEHDETGTKVSVGANRGGQRVSAKAGSLEDITGDGGWSGDLFGTGELTTVSFTIGELDGGPDITGVSVDGPDGLTAEIGSTNYSTEDDDELEQKASVKIVFTQDGQRRTLSIKVTVETESDGTTTAKVAISLGKARGVAQPAPEEPVAKIWSGLLCDGSTATAEYTVNPDGTISIDTATPEPERVRTGDRRITVEFARQARVEIRTRTTADGLVVDVKEKIHCRQAPDPAVNTEVAERAERERAEREHSGDRGRDRDRAEARAHDGQDSDRGARGRDRRGD